MGTQHFPIKMTEKKFDKVSCIYKITSPSGAVYVGQTVNMYLREIHYRKGHCKKQRNLYNSLMKYGYDNHTIEIIEECERCDLNKREAFWIEKLDTFYNGMNLTKGGDTPEKSPASKQRISDSKKGIKNWMYGRKGTLHHNFQRKASPETCRRLRDSHIGKSKGKDNPYFKGVVLAHKDGNLIGEFEGVNDAAAKLGLHHPNISKVLLGKRNHTGGYTFTRP